MIHSFRLHNISFCYCYIENFICLTVLINIWRNAWIPLKYIPMKELIPPWSMWMSAVYTILSTVFQNGCGSWHSSQQLMRYPAIVFPLYHLALSDLFIFAFRIKHQILPCCGLDCKMIENYWSDFFADGRIIHTETTQEFIWINY